MKILSLSSYILSSKNKLTQLFNIVRCVRDRCVNTKGPTTFVIKNLQHFNEAFRALLNLVFSFSFGHISFWMNFSKGRPIQFTYFLLLLFMMLYLNLYVILGFVGFYFRYGMHIPKNCNVHLLYLFTFEVHCFTSFSFFDL